MAKNRVAKHIEDIMPIVCQREGVNDRIMPDNEQSNKESSKTIGTCEQILPFQPGKQRKLKKLE